MVCFSEALSAGFDTGEKRRIIFLSYDAFILKIDSLREHIFMPQASENTPFYPNEILAVLQKQLLQIQAQKSLIREKIEKLKTDHLAELESLNKQKKDLQAMIIKICELDEKKSFYLDEEDLDDYFNLLSEYKNQLEFDNKYRIATTLRKEPRISSDDADRIESGLQFCIKVKRGVLKERLYRININLLFLQQNLNLLLEAESSIKTEINKIYEKIIAYYAPQNPNIDNINDQQKEISIKTSIVFRNIFKK